MKRVLIAVVIITLGIMMSSCNKHTCPAYVQKDAEQTENAG